MVGDTAQERIEVPLTAHHSNSLILGELMIVNLNYQKTLHLLFENIDLFFKFAVWSRLRSILREEAIRMTGKMSKSNGVLLSFDQANLFFKKQRI